MLELLLTIFEGAFAKFSGFFLKLFNGTLVNATALVDEMSSGSGFARIDVSDDCDGQPMEQQQWMRTISDHRPSERLFKILTDDVDVNLIFTHVFLVIESEKVC